MVGQQTVQKVAGTVLMGGMKENPIKGGFATSIARKQEKVGVSAKVSRQSAKNLRLGIY